MNLLPIGALSVLTHRGRHVLASRHTKVNDWPEAVSDGLTLPCADCGDVPRFDYRVTPEFWAEWVPDKPDRLGVVCLPCLDRRCRGTGLAEALVEVQWTGTGHTVVMTPSLRHEYVARPAQRLAAEAGE